MVPSRPLYDGTPAAFSRASAFRHAVPAAMMQDVPSVRAIRIVHVPSFSDVQIPNTASASCSPPPENASP